MFGSLRGGNSGGGPIDTITFWLMILFTVVVVCGLVGFMFYAVDTI